MLKANVTVTLKKEVSDPQGLAVGHALAAIHFKGAQKVRVGKFFEILLEGVSREDAERQLHDACQKLLSNPVVEEYRFEIVEG